MTTPKLTHVLLALFAGFAITGVVLLVFARDTGATGAPESCGPQHLTVTADTVSVDPDGCPVDLVVWSGNGTATDVFVLPQIQQGLVTGDGLLSLELPCGWWQADVYDADQFELPATLTQEWIDANGAVWFDLLAGDHGMRECTPELTPDPLVIERPAVASAAAVPVVAEPKVAG